MAKCHDAEHTAESVEELRGFLEAFDNGEIDFVTGEVRVMYQFKDE